MAALAHVGGRVLQQHRGVRQCAFDSALAIKCSVSSCTALGVTASSRSAAKVQMATQTVGEEMGKVKHVVYGVAAVALLGIATASAEEGVATGDTSDKRIG